MLIWWYSILWWDKTGRLYGTWAVTYAFATVACGNVLAMVLWFGLLAFLRPPLSQHNLLVALFMTPTTYFGNINQ